MNRTTFERYVTEAVQSLPEQFKYALDNVDVVIEVRPSPAVRREVGRGPLLVIHPRVCRTPEGACMLYPGDAGYDDWEIERPGARHRLWALGEGWHYERD